MEINASVVDESTDIELGIIDSASSHSDQTAQYFSTNTSERPSSDSSEFTQDFNDTVQCDGNALNLTVPDESFYVNNNSNNNSNNNHDYSNNVCHETDEIYCIICQDQSQQSSELPCGHKYCTTCISEYVSLKITDGTVYLKCFTLINNNTNENNDNNSINNNNNNNKQCGTDIPETTILNILSNKPDIIQKYLKRKS